MEWLDKGKGPRKGKTESGEVSTLDRFIGLRSPLLVERKRGERLNEFYPPHRFSKKTNRCLW